MGGSIKRKTKRAAAIKTGRTARIKMAQACLMLHVRIPAPNRLNFGQLAGGALGGNCSAHCIDALGVPVAVDNHQPPLFDGAVVSLELGIGLAHRHAPEFFCASTAVRNIFQHIAHDAPMLSRLARKRYFSWLGPSVRCLTYRAVKNYGDYSSESLVGCGCCCWSICGASWLWAGYECLRSA
jgi:hypothetical protein